MSKVDFIGIGAQKAASTWLHHVLFEHSSVSSSVTKELNFFTANYDRGYSWYENCFKEDLTGHLKGECSPSYFFSRDAVQRAWRYNPDLKLICILRDPIDRAFSNHLHEIRKGHIAANTSFEVALERNPAYLMQSQYKTNLENWLECFKKDAFLVLFSEDISTNPKKTYNLICRHLGIKPEENPISIFERHHENIAYRNQTFQRALRFSGDAMRLMGMQNLVSRAKRLPGLKMALSLNKQHLKNNVSPPDVDTIKMLAEYFRADIEFVARFSGRKVLPWPTCLNHIPERSENCI